MITLEQTRWHRRCLTSSRPQKGGPKMTTPIGYSVAIPRYAMNNASIGQAYRTKKSFVAVHFNSAGKGEIVFLPGGSDDPRYRTIFLFARGVRGRVRETVLQRFRSRFISPV